MVYFWGMDFIGQDVDVRIAISRQWRRDDPNYLGSNRLKLNREQITLYSLSVGRETSDEL